MPSRVKTLKELLDELDIPYEENRRLAEEYFSQNFGRFSGSSNYRQKITRIIATASENIQKYYRKHGNLDELRIRSIGPVIRGNLRGIFGRRESGC